MSRGQAPTEPGWPRHSSPGPFPAAIRPQPGPEIKSRSVKLPYVLRPLFRGTVHPLTGPPDRGSGPLFCMGGARPHRWTEQPGAARRPGGTVATPPDICTRRACPGRDGARNVKPPNLRMGGPGACWPRGQPSGQRKRRSEGRARNGDMCDRAEAREAPMQFGTLDPSTLQAYHTRRRLSTTRYRGAAGAGGPLSTSRGGARAQRGPRSVRAARRSARNPKPNPRARGRKAGEGGPRSGPTEPARGRSEARPPQGAAEGAQRRGRAQGGPTEGRRRARSSGARSRAQRERSERGAEQGRAADRPNGGPGEPGPRRSAGPQRAGRGARPGPSDGRAPQPKAERGARAREPGRAPGPERAARRDASPQRTEGGPARSRGPGSPAASGGGETREHTAEPRARPAWAERRGNRARSGAAAQRGPRRTRQAATQGRSRAQRERRQRAAASARPAGPRSERSERRARSAATRSGGRGEGSRAAGPERARSGGDVKSSNDDVLPFTGTGSGPASNGVELHFSPESCKNAEFGGRYSRYSRLNRPTARGRSLESLH